METEEEKEHRCQTKPLFAIHTQRKAAVDISFVPVLPRSVITFLPLFRNKKKVGKEEMSRTEINFFWLCNCLMMN